MIKPWEEIRGALYILTVLCRCPDCGCYVEIQGENYEDARNNFDYCPHCGKARYDYGEA